jgi:hypothetical protein
VGENDDDEVGNHVVSDPTETERYILARDRTPEEADAPVNNKTENSAPGVCVEYGDDRPGGQTLELVSSDELYGLATCDEDYGLVHATFDEDGCLANVIYDEDSAHPFEPRLLAWVEHT